VMLVKRLDIADHSAEKASCLVFLNDALHHFALLCFI
jgi:hypothetical protein